MRTLRLLVLVAACTPLPTTQPDASTTDASDDGTTATDAAADALTDAPATVDAALDGGAACDAGLTLCAGQCVPLSTTTNCSACGQACTGGATCTNGACSMQTFIAVGSGSVFLAANATSLFYQVGLQFNGNIEQLSMDGGTPSTFEQNVTSPDQVVADSNNLYEAVNSTGSAIMQRALDGGGGSSLAASTWVSALAINSASVFYATSNDGKIWSVPIGGSSATPILSNQTGTLNRLAADDNNVYFWAAGGDSGTITQATVTGASPLALSVSSGRVTSIVVDATTVYFASYNDGIYAVPIGGGTTTRLGNYGGQLQIDATNLYFVQNDPVYARQDVVRMAKSGGPQIVIASDSVTYPINAQLVALGPTMFFAWAGYGNNTVILATPK